MIALDASRPSPAARLTCVVVLLKLEAEHVPDAAAGELGQAQHKDEHVLLEMHAWKGEGRERKAGSRGSGNDWLDRFSKPRIRQVARSSGSGGPRRKPRGLMQRARLQSTRSKPASQVSIAKTPRSRERMRSGEPGGPRWLGGYTLFEEVEAGGRENE